VLKRRWVKVLVFLAGLAPALWLAWQTWNGNLTANPLEYITHFTGDWTIRLVVTTLMVTPLRKLLHLPDLIRFRRMIGLYAFFYGCLHFLTWLWLDKLFDIQEMLKDVAKRRFITVGMAALLSMLPLAITGEGQEALVRSGEFLFVGVAILLATTLVARKAGASHARSRWFGDGLGRAWRRVRAARTTTAFVVCLVIFTGGISLSWSYAKRLSPPPQVNGPPAIVTPDDIAAARWLLGEYGPNHRIATDFTTGLAFDTYGDQNVLSGASDGAHVWRIFFPLTMTRSVYQELSASNVEFVVVQKQLTEGGPPPAYAVPFFDDGEPGNEDHRPVSVISQEKFASAAAFSMVYRSATITIYRVHQSRVRAATGSA